MELKTCNICGLTKPLNAKNFVPQNTKREHVGWRSMCRKCYNEYKRTMRAVHNANKPTCTCCGHTK